MSHLSNRSILEKADLALADLTAGGGLLQPAQAQKFMRLLIKQSVLLQLATVVPMASPKQQISKIKFGARVLRPGQEGTALGAVDRVKPDLSDVELDAKLFKAEVRLSDEVLEDSIERGELRQTMMEMIADAISRDMEEVLVSGDTASADPFLATMDGVLKQATSHVVDAAAAPISKDLLRDLVKTLPSEYLRDKSAMRYLTSVDADLDYRNTLAERATAVGDKFLEGDAPVLYSGVPVQPIHTFGVAKAYDTKVGTHTFLTQMDDAAPLTVKLKQMEFGTSTGRQRMVGWYDAVEKGDVLRYGGYQDLMINKIDALSGATELLICTAYADASGKRYGHVPRNEALRSAPVYFRKVDLLRTAEIQPDGTMLVPSHPRMTVVVDRNVRRDNAPATQPAASGKIIIIPKPKPAKQTPTSDKPVVASR